VNPGCFIYNKRPLKLVFQQCFNDVRQAISFEKQVKGWRREKKEVLIAGKWELLPQLAKNNKA
jgi:putative endonuclease